MHRHALTDEQWERLRPLLPAKRPGPDSKLGDRQFIDAALYRAKTQTGVAWRDLPERFGPWKTIYNRFSNWAARGLWAQMLKALQLKVDRSGSIVDGSVIRAHQDASGGKGGSDAMLWAVLEEVFQPSFTPSSTAKVAHSTSRSRRGSSTRRRSPTS
jgi:transposase